MNVFFLFLPENVCACVEVAFFFNVAFVFKFVESSNAPVEMV